MHLLRLSAVLCLIACLWGCESKSTPPTPQPSASDAGMVLPSKKEFNRGN